MRDVTYEFEQLPIHVGHGASRRVVARVAGVADMVFVGDDLEEFEVCLTDESGRTLPLATNDPLYPQIKREIMNRHDRFDFDADRPLRDDNREHRLVAADVL